MRNKTKIYGSIGICADCCKRKRLHGFLKGVLRCFACYNRERRRDPRVKARHHASVKRYRAKMKDAKR